MIQRPEVSAPPPRLGLPAVRLVGRPALIPPTLAQTLSYAAPPRSSARTSRPRSAYTTTSAPASAGSDPPLARSSDDDGTLGARPCARGPARDVRRRRAR